MWTVAVVIAVIGAVYCLAVARRKRFTPAVIPPADDQPLAGAASAAGGKPGPGDALASVPMLSAAAAR